MKEFNKITIYLKEKIKMKEFNKIYREYFGKILLAVLGIGAVISLIALAVDEFLGLIWACIFAGIELIAVMIYVALDFYEIAERKGYESVKCFLYPLLLGMVGYLYIIALKDNTQTGMNTTGVGTDLPEI